MSTCPPVMALISRMRRATDWFARQARIAPAVVGLVLVLGSGRPAMAANGAGDEIPLAVGRSVVLDHPDDITRISITDPAIADAVPISTKEILINAKAPGVSTLIIWSKSGERNFFSISVTPNLEQVQDHLRAAFPGEDIRVTGSKGVITLDGRVSGPDVVDRAIAMVTGAGGGSIVNNLVLPPPPPERQIMIKVRFAELQRNAGSEFAANILSTGALNTPAAISTQQFGPPRGF